jgi:uncharacterized protein (TIGR03790 family)
MAGVWFSLLFMASIVREIVLFCIAKIAPNPERLFRGIRRATVHIVQCLVLLSPSAMAQKEVEPASVPLAVPPGATAPAPWIQMPRLRGRITAQELGLVINTADPYSVAVGEYYMRRRGIPEGQVLRVTLLVKAKLSQAEFQALDAQIRGAMPGHVQALALAWSQPYAVECNSITSALASGFQADLCKQTCAPSAPSPYFGYTGARPQTDLGLRPAMLIAARSVESARKLIDRGIASDHSLPPAFTPVSAWFMSTHDAARNVRMPLFPPAGLLRPWGVAVQRGQGDGLPDMHRVLVLETGLGRVEGASRVDWVPGALADHLTSYGGQLEAQPEQGQMSVLDWIEAGATASYGTVSEPCNHLQKFPHPQVLLLSYIQGVSALEAYWHSVAWPAQGVFVGEPLAAPFAPPF